MHSAAIPSRSRAAASAACITAAVGNCAPGWHSTLPVREPPPNLCQQEAARAHLRERALRGLVRQRRGLGRFRGWPRGGFCGGLRGRWLRRWLRRRRRPRAGRPQTRARAYFTIHGTHSNLVDF